LPAPPASANQARVPTAEVLHENNESAQRKEEIGADGASPEQSPEGATNRRVPSRMGQHHERRHGAPADLDRLNLS
jgi:hypothetical protein